MLGLLGSACWMLMFLLLLRPVLTRNPQGMLRLGLLLLLGGRTGPVPCRVGFPKTCLPLLGIYCNSSGHWWRPVEWRRDPVWRWGSWDIVSGVRLLMWLLVGCRICSGEGGHGWHYNRVSRERIHDKNEFAPTLGFILQRLDGRDWVISPLANDSTAFI